MAGDGGQQAVEAAVLSFMPDEKKEADIATVMSEIKGIQESELYRMSSETAQGALATALRLLDDVHCRRRPERSQASTKFLGLMWDRLPWFVSYKSQKTEAGGSGSAGSQDASTVVRGAEAVRQQWEAVKLMKDVTLDKLEWIGPLSHVLPESERKQVAELTTRILRGAPVPAGTKAKPAKPAASKSKKAKEDHDSKASAARAVLGL